MAKKGKRADEVLIIEIKEDAGPPASEGIPEWMATFADMVTLLLCFFVLLLSFTNQDIANFKMLRGAMKDAFGVQTETQATEIPYADESRRYKTMREQDEQIRQLNTTLEQFVQTENLKSASVSPENNGVMLRVGDGVMFEPGSAKLSPQAALVLVEVIQVLSGSEFKLTVMGHTDGHELGPDLLDNNWELSATRAAACLRFILEHSRVPASRL
ncbi:MAG: flagellar motor protein MotB, partial [Desulfovibrionaceae bacterium]